MQTRTVTAIATGTAEEAVAQLIHQSKTGLDGASPAMLLAFASTSQPLRTVLGELQAAYPKSCVLGASSAGEFTEQGDQKHAVSLFALAGKFEVFAGMSTGLRANVVDAVQHAVTELPTSRPGLRYRTAVLLLDPLSGNGEEATMVAATLLGEHVRLAGGAAGDDLKMMSTQVGIGSRVASDAIMVAMIFSDAPLGVGVCHGHVPISPPFIATRADEACRTENRVAVEWARGALIELYSSRFPRAPHRTRRAPFDTHRALDRR